MKVINPLQKWLVLFSVIVTGITACSSCSDNKDESEKSRPETLLAAPFPVGAALKTESIKNNVAYRELVQKELKSITPEIVMKMWTITKGKGQYFWDDADFIADFAQSNKLRLHGHCLVWYKDGTRTNPDMQWFVNFKGTKDEWKQLMREYILAVAGRYKGKVTSWDVVNEAVADDGNFRGDNDIWCKNIGAPEYIDWAFRCAHEADPDALLFYNDYGQEYSSAKRQAINNLVKGMIERGVPVHGIGLQLHTHVNRNTGDLREAIKVAAQTGLKVHVSELDVSVNTSDAASAEFTADRKEAQYKSYRAVSETMASLPKEQQYGITTWGLQDPVKTPPDWPLMFDSKFQRKKAYDGIVDGFSK